MKKLILISALLFSFNGWAEVKDLICTVKVSEEILNLSWILPVDKREYISGYGWVETVPDEESKRFERCKNSEIAWQHSIRLDTDDIGKQDANVENSMIENCTSARTSFPFMDHGKTKAFLMRTTPSYLLFSQRDHFNNPFQVDRKTLEGYSNTKKVAFDCVLKDVEVEENIL